MSFPSAIDIRLATGLGGWTIGFFALALGFVFSYFQGYRNAITLRNEMAADPDPPHILFRETAPLLEETQQEQLEGGPATRQVNSGWRRLD